MQQLLTYLSVGKDWKNWFKKKKKLKQIIYIFFKLCFDFNSVWSITTGRSVINISLKPKVRMNGSYMIIYHV